MLSEKRCQGLLGIAFTDRDPAISESLLNIVANHTARTIQIAHLIEQMRSSEVRYRRLVEELPIGLSILDRRGRLIYGNPAARRILGVPSEDLSRTEGQKFYELPTIRASIFEKPLKALMEKGTPIRGLEGPYTSPHGRKAILRLNGIPLKSGEQITGALLLVEDITERTRTEQHCRLLADEAPIAILLLDKDGRLIYGNEASKKVFKVPPGQDLDSLGKVVLDIPQVKKAGLVEPIGKLLRGEPFHNLKVVYPLDVGPVHLRGHGIPLTEDGEVTGAMILVEDITEQVRAEEQFRQIFNASPEALFVEDLDLSILEVNRMACEMLGYTRDELLKMKVSDLLPPEEMDRVMSYMEEFNRNGFVRFQTVSLRKDGTPVPVEVIAHRFTWGGREAALMSVRDVTDRVRMEEELARQAREWQETFDASVEAILIQDKNYVILKANRAFLRLVGADTLEEVVGKRCYELVHGTDSPPPFCPFSRALETKSPIQARFLEPKSQSWFEVSISPILRDGKLQWVVHTIWDITERVRMEENLRHAQKMEALGTLTGGIAHDFNNILTAIMGYTSLLLSKMDSSHPHYQAISTIHQASERAAGLVHQLLQFSRKIPLRNLQPVSINEVVEEINRVIRETFPREIEILLELDPNLPPVRGDRSQLYQVILNLCVNARDAMPQGGRLRIATDVVEVRPDPAHPERRPGPYCRLTVEDTGVGMNEAVLSRLFEPFFTTKEHGTGLGLSIAYGIVTSHGGFIEVSSTPGQGSAFEVYLPVCEKLEPPSKPEEERPAEREIPEATVLLVDDEEAIRHLGRDMLQVLGLRVLSASDGEEALRLYQEHRSKIDVIILDLSMPKMNGWEVFRRLKEIDPDVRVLISTGYIDRDVEELVASGVCGVVHKPYTLEHLREAIAAVLRGGGGVKAYFSKGYERRQR